MADADGVVLSLQCREGSSASGLSCHERLSFHDFSQALVDLGVKNAIYLVGSSAYLKAKLEDGHIYEFGERIANIHPNSNYIFWH